MKYFENLPKTTFSSTIGNFTVSNFFTYIDTSSTFLQLDDISIDNKTTLLEASYQYYNDPNSFWTFLVANKAINPFTLASFNVNLFLKDTENKLNMEIVGNTAGTTGYVFPKGSLILPFTSNTGSSASYSSVGNFNLDGPLSIIESVSYYDGNIIIKDQRGATFSFITTSATAGSAIVILSKTAGGTYSIQKPYYPYNTKPAYDKTVRVELSEEKITEEKGGKSKYESFKEVPSYIEADIGISGGTEITALTAVETQNKNIKAVVPDRMGILKTSFVTTKYI